MIKSIKYLFVFAIALVTNVANAQSVSTYAGNYVLDITTNVTVGGYTGDGGPAINARMDSPYGIDCDNNGNLYIADQNNNVIRKVEKQTGIITTLITDDGTGLLITPNSIAIDRPKNNLYFISLNKLYKYPLSSTTGVPTKLLDLATGYTGFCVKNDSMFFTNIGNHTINFIFLPSITGLSTPPTVISGYLNTAGSANGVLGKYNSPYDICFDANGDLLIAELGLVNNAGLDTGKVRKLVLNVSITLNEVFTVFTNLNNPQGITALNDGTFYVSTNSNKIYNINNSGQVLKVIGNGIVGYLDDSYSNSKFGTATRLANDNLGNVYVSDTYNHLIRTFGCLPAQPPSLSTSTNTEIYCLNSDEMTISITDESDLDDNLYWVWHKETCDGPILDTTENFVIEDLDQPITYAVRAEGGCIQKGECQIITIDVQDCDNAYFIKNNTFTPNNDGINDTFVIGQLAPNTTLFFFNSWGDLVKRIDNYDNVENVWDGLGPNNIKLPPGTYFYTVENNNNKIASGWVQLLR